MIREENNLKDTYLSTNSNSSPMSFNLSYIKTNKLVTALYMVTDIMDTSEPIRHKLRFLGGEIISDINGLKFFNRTDRQIEVSRKISEIISFLDIASAVYMISVMNRDVLKREFVQLQKALENSSNKSPWLSDFLAEEKIEQSANSPAEDSEHLRIGVQKGSTLLKAIKDIAMSDRMSNRTNIMSNRITKGHINFLNKNSSDLKKKRREEILNIIKSNKGETTISDIKSKAVGVLASCGEKTIQRELVSMVTDNVLEKSGSKRWSKYILKFPS